MTDTKKRIIILGVDGEIGWGLSISLPDEGYDAKFGPSSIVPPFNELFDELSAIKYDMVIISYWAFYPVLPELRERFPEIKILFLSSRDKKWEDEFVRLYGVTEIVSVPFDYEEFLIKVRKILHV